jgi:hypothetical protein
MSTRGRMTHCEVAFLAGQKNATSGNAGEEELELVSEIIVSGPAEIGRDTCVRRFFLGRCEEDILRDETGRVGDSGDGGWFGER